MGASRSKPSVYRASDPLSGPRSPPTASVPAKEKSDGASGLSGILACIPPSGAAGALRRQLRCAPPEDGGGAKRTKDVGNGVVPDTALLNDDGRFQLASAVLTDEQEPESLLFSCQPLGAASDMVLCPSGSVHGVQPVGDCASGSPGVLACIPPSEAAGPPRKRLRPAPPRKRLRSAPPEDGGGAKRTKDVGNGVVPDTALLNDDGRFQLASAVLTDEQEPESLLFSCQPLGAASDMVLCPSGSVHGVQPVGDCASGSPGVLACIPPSEAAGPPRKRLRPAPPRKRLRSAPPEDGGGAKRTKDVGNGVVPDTALLNDDGRFQLASAVLTDEQEPESLLFSCQPLGAASDMVLCPSGSVHGVQPMGLCKLDAAKHKVFLSHSGAQKDFVDQLCVDLQGRGYFFPFFDQRHHSLPIGEDFAPLIIEAARLCRVAVIVLSEEFLCSKWPMIELAEFYDAQQGARGGVGELKLLPLFFKLSIEEVKDEGRWMPKWKEHAMRDKRIDLSKWSAAVTALCKPNGLDFGKYGKKEVPYRECIVKNIFKLCKPDPLFGSSKCMVGSSRMCEAMSTQFVEDSTIGARVLGIYGMAGLGKTLLAKALHDYFNEEFLGRVCYVDMRDGERAQRQKQMLRILCVLTEDMDAHIGNDVDMGLNQMQNCMRHHRVFLIFDNITYKERCLKEVADYLRVGFHPESRILITSRSKAILEDLLPNKKFFTPMPILMVEEARALFWTCAAPVKAISELTREEHEILRICLRKCWFYSGEGGSYHPMVLMALADYFSRSRGSKATQLLVWKDLLEKKMDLVRNVLNASEDYFSILALQFYTFDFSEQLLFMDLALYSKEMRLDYHSAIDWSCELYEKNGICIETMMRNLKRSGMIDCTRSSPRGISSYQVGVPSLYREFAQRYAMGRLVAPLNNCWGVCRPSSEPIKSLSPSSEPIKMPSDPNKMPADLIRCRIAPMNEANARLVKSNSMQTLSNLVRLQLSCCDDLQTLNLEGLHYLRDLHLRMLPKLKTITLSKNSSQAEYAGIYDSLRLVRLFSLDSLENMPDLRQCTKLYSVLVENCPKVRDLERADCPSLKGLILHGVKLDYTKKLLDFGCLKTLEELLIMVESDNDWCLGYWVKMRLGAEYDFRASVGDYGPCSKLLAEIYQLLYGLNGMICTKFGKSHHRYWSTLDLRMSYSGTDFESPM